MREPGRTSGARCRGHIAPSIWRSPIDVPDHDRKTASMIRATRRAAAKIAPAEEHPATSDGEDWRPLAVVLASTRSKTLTRMVMGPHNALVPRSAGHDVEEELPAIAPSITAASTVVGNAAQRRRQLTFQNARDPDQDPIRKKLFQKGTVSTLRAMPRPARCVRSQDLASPAS